MTDNPSEDLAHRLSTRDLDPALIPHAMRYFVSAWTDDLSPQAMREHLDQACGNESVSEAVSLLADDPDALEQASLAILSNGWQDAATRDLAAGAIDAAGTKLPVVELGLICLVGVYGLWLLATGGRRSEHTVIRHEADGSWTEEVSTTWYGPAEPLGVIVQILSPGTTGFDPAGGSVQDGPAEIGEGTPPPDHPSVPT